MLEFLGKLAFWRRAHAPESRRLCNRAADFPVVAEISSHLSRFAAVTRSPAVKIVVRYSW
jgi:hypothetical protein